MSEFKFACPQCRQPIQCDTAYCGSVIACPMCQKSIVVPPAEEPTIRIKKSTLKKAGLISLGTLFTLALVAVAVHFVGGPKSLTFKATVDGSDVIRLRGNQLWVEHLSWQQPSRMSVNGAPWNPVWISNQNATPPDATDNATPPPVLSTTEPYRLSGAFKPGDPDKIKVTKRMGRGTVAIAELPKPGNEQCLAILIDDGPVGGAASYEFTVSW